MDGTQLIKIISSVDSMVAALNSAKLAFHEKSVKLKKIEEYLIECYNTPSIKKAMDKELSHGFGTLYREIIRNIENFINDSESHKEVVHSNIREDLARYQRELALLNKETMR
jgi:hypothetical protein